MKVVQLTPYNPDSKAIAERRNGWFETSFMPRRDYYVRLDASDYSVDPAVIDRFVDITPDLDRVGVPLDGRIVADHARVWA